MKTKRSPGTGVAAAGSVCRENVNTNSAAPGFATRAASCAASRNSRPERARFQIPCATIRSTLASGSGIAPIGARCSRTRSATPAARARSAAASSIGCERSIPVTRRTESAPTAGERVEMLGENSAILEPPGAEAEPQPLDRHREAAPIEIEDVAADAAAAENGPLPLGEPTADASFATQEPLVPVIEPPQEPSAQDDELEALERAVEDGRELQRHVDDLFAETDQRLRRLRAEATQIRQLLQRDLTEMRVRILELVETEGAELVGSAESALADARREVDDLRERLAAVEHDRHQLLERLKTERQRAGDADRRVERLRKELRAEGDSKNRLQRELEALDLDASRRFVAEVYQAWDRVTLPADRARFPWREPIVGPDFLDSLAATQGVSRERVLDVCAHVACGRAAEIGGLELHPLRASEGGGASQLEREDGAKAWRCSLQASTAAARRLHYWQLPDGGVELAKVGYHDDLSIR